MSQTARSDDTDTSSRNDCGADPMQHWMTEQDGVTAVEYGIISALVGASLIAVGPWLVGVMLDLISAIVGNMT
jgi:Flp pilus assembly pilin Flp